MRIKLLIVLFAILPFNVSAESNALPYLAVGTTPCQFNFNLQSYGTIWNFTSVGSEVQRVVLYGVYPDGYYTMYNQTLQSGEHRYLEEWNTSQPPIQYLIQTYDTGNYITGEQYFNVPHCTARVWIPKVEGVNVLS